MDELKLCARCLKQRSPIVVSGWDPCACGESKVITLQKALQLFQHSLMVQHQAIEGLTDAAGQQAIILKSLTAKKDKATSGGLINMPPSARGLPRGG